MTPKTFYHIYPGCSSQLRSHKSFFACLLGREYGESFLLMLANVLQVLLWGSVIAGHLRHCQRGRELLRWAAKGEGGGGGCAQGMRNTLVRTQKLALAPPESLTHTFTPYLLLFQQPATHICCEQDHTLKERTSPTIITQMHTQLVYFLLTTNVPIRCF